MTHHTNALVWRAGCPVAALQIQHKAAPWRCPVAPPSLSLTISLCTQHVGRWGTDLPHRVYERLPAEFGDRFVTSTLLEERLSSDGTTTKLLFEMQDGLRVEVSACQSPYGPHACAQYSRPTLPFLTAPVVVDVAVTVGRSLPLMHGLAQSALVRIRCSMTLRDPAARVQSVIMRYDSSLAKR